ncbi:DUF998 domain-containing protein [Kitasatospora sp. NPDC056181]|uniref:DUF998 domain-containing protein n=1 Tax=Kitasatospora sp. NPDC056181 TaxID=3345737 RepID=UPI0035E1AB0D
MTNTLAAAPLAAPATRTLLLAGAAAGPLFLAVGIAQGLTREGFDFSRNAISQLALGDAGWIQTANFLLAGVLLTAGAVGFRQALRNTPGGTWAPRLVAVFGASFLLSAAFEADPGAGFPVGAPEGRVTGLSAHGTVHMIGGSVGYLALCAAFLVLARHFAAAGRRGWALASRLMPVGVLAGFAGSGVTVSAFTAGAALGLGWLSATAARLTA